MSQWVCESCGYRYDPDAGDSLAGIPPGMPWELLPEDWTCPVCGLGAESFSDADAEGEANLLDDE
jgi:rubredoxin